MGTSSSAKRSRHKAPKKPGSSQDDAPRTWHSIQPDATQSTHSQRAETSQPKKRDKTPHRIRRRRIRALASMQGASAVITEPDTLPVTSGSFIVPTSGRFTVAASGNLTDGSAHVMTVEAADPAPGTATVVMTWAGGGYTFVETTGENGDNATNTIDQVSSTSIYTENLTPVELVTSEELTIITNCNGNITVETIHNAIPLDKEPDSSPNTVRFYEI